MGSLTEQLFSAGLIAEKDKDQIIAKEGEQEKSKVGQNLATLSTKSGRPAHFDGLKCCESVGEFKDVARRLLTEEGPDHIHEVIKLAHRLKSREGGGKLVWLLYQIRDLLPEVEERDRKRFFKRALRKSGATVELPK